MLARLAGSYDSRACKLISDSEMAGSGATVSFRFLFFYFILFIFCGCPIKLSSECIGNIKAP